jgi:hypothetical protein
LISFLSLSPPGTEYSARSDEEGRLFLESLAEEDRSFLEAHQGLGNSQKAEVAWLEKRLRETGDRRYEYEEVDVCDFLSQHREKPRARSVFA